MPNETKTKYDIGHCKPPKTTQFRSGVSGNPKGRPKGARNLKTVLAKALNEKVILNENGVRKAVTKLEAAIKQLVNKAISGEWAAMRLLTALLAVAEPEVTRPESAQLSDLDSQIMAGVLKRWEEYKKEENNEENE